MKNEKLKTHEDKIVEVTLNEGVRREDIYYGILF